MPPQAVWRVQLTGDVLCLMDGDRMMAVCGHDMEKAEELVRRLNARDALVAALEEIASVGCQDTQGIDGWTCATHDGTGLWCAPCQARAALWRPR